MDGVELVPHERALDTQNSNRKAVSDVKEKSNVLQYRQPFDADWFGLTESEFQGGNRPHSSYRHTFVRSPQHV